MISRYEIEQFVLRCVSDPSRWNEDDEETRQLAIDLAPVADESRPDRERLADVRDLVREIVFDMTGGEIAITFRDPPNGN